ncbi:TrbI/VirB10 family protein [Mesorhizobium sp. WSM4307]|uniref:TrbI/VirB10 family protein n=1 Tax=unclassified Mesorhizobium TaxID=325217 RepID=UPI00115E5EAF|nr:MULTISPECIES: TrbI/VirB10 family protein [unclassified Mesorhizobium]TRC75255.1 TrbI/VirB10 family protein [Mesorhizobium sp. WSM4310]TRC77936.1 TrbI/VirB10 family protein [Mesorhizobium sp. WSM4315]TRC78668.1 TrbI/VirB10 family protein [Mesorhizobium sp. WSM4307]
MTDSDVAAEPMRLRADPPRVTRLSRKVLASIGLATSLSIGVALVYALRDGDTSKQGDELISTSNRQPADGLASLPRDYSGPILGPPLPGDLGRPILDAQNKGQSPMIATPAVDEAEQRRVTEEEAARTSHVFFQEGQGSATIADTSGSLAMPNLGEPAGQAGQPNAQDRQSAFLNTAADRQTVAPDRVMPPASPYVLQAGAVIPAALVTGIRSDLPGQISAQVTENVYDSPTGRALLIPQGTRIVGQYDNGVGFGQRRVLLVWNRLIFPDGHSIVLERQPGTDPQGYAGLEDGVDYHWGELFKAATLSTLLSVGAQAGSSGQESEIARALRDGASDSVSRVGQQIVQRQLDIAPTLAIRPGFPVRVLVTRDLVLEPYGG